MNRPHVRRAVRFALAVPGRYRLTGRSTWTEVRTINVSDSGLLFRAPEHLDKGALLELVIHCPMQLGNIAPGEFRSVARVTRVEHTPEGECPVGAEFVEVRPNHDG